MELGAGLVTVLGMVGGTMPATAHRPSAMRAGRRTARLDRRPGADPISGLGCESARMGCRMDAAPTLVLPMAKAVTARGPKAGRRKPRGRKAQSPR
jgi:hypothetical protein